MEINDEIVFTVFFAIIACFLISILTLNLYFILRNGFYVQVNCWFCNQNSRVLYSQRNSFNCPICLQYNGFSEDGGYNKVIEAQHNSSQNTSNVISSEKMASSYNGLCNTCNNNLNLKVIQLANYEPLNDKNFDIEIEHFRQQLDKTYKLCRQCNKTVKSTIRKQNAWLFANRIKDRKKLTNLSQGNIQETKPVICLMVLKCFLLILSILSLVLISELSQTMSQHFGSIVFQNNIISTEVYNYISNLTLLEFHDWHLTGENLLQAIQTKETTILPLLGFTVEIFMTLFEINLKNTAISKCNKLLGWIILIITFGVKFSMDIASYINTLQVFCSLWLIYNYGKLFSESPQRISKKKYRLKKLSTTNNIEDYSDDEVDSGESLNVTETSNSFGTNKLAADTEHLNCPRLIKTASLCHNENLSTNNTHTAMNTDLDEHFNGLNLGAFKPYATRQTFSPNPFLIPSQSLSPNRVFSFDGRASSVASSNQNQGLLFSSLSPTFKNRMEPPFNNSHMYFSRPSSFTNMSNFSTKNCFQNVTPNRQSNFPDYCQNSFRPVQTANTFDYSGRTVKMNPLAPPKLNLFKPCYFRLGDNDQVSFSTSAGFSHNNGFTFVQKESVFPLPVVNNLSTFVNDKTINSSRSSSRSSGFVSSTDLNSHNVSLPNSRNHSPERSTEVPYHLKLD